MNRKLSAMHFFNNRLSRKSLKMIILLLEITIILGCSKDCEITSDQESLDLVICDPVPVTKSNPMKLYAHYMPWFESKEINGQWGIHWTMATQNPDIVGNDGRRQIASHFYPLIGPYSSRDKDVIEYHLLLMKLSGIIFLIQNNSIET